MYHETIQHVKWLKKTEPEKYANVFIDEYPYWLNCAMQHDKDNEKQNKEHKFPSILDM